MSSPFQPARVAVAGGGAAGYTAAILLRANGLSVDLFEARPGNSAGSGIMLQANALRVLRSAGVLEAVRSAGYGFDSTGVRLPDATSRLVGEIAAYDPHLPQAVGIARAQLAAILHARAVAVGVDVRLGVEVASVASRSDSVAIELRSQVGRESASYDLLVAADGLNSGIRRLVGIDLVPRHLDLGVWRVLTSRPASVVRAEITNGGTAYFAGFAPTSHQAMYAWLVDDYVDLRELDPAEHVKIVRALASGYHGPWDEIRARLRADTPVSYTRYSEILVPPPWHRGRTVLIGDAVHACPPTLAQGAAQALEDGLVLAEVLATAGSVDEDVLTAFAARRYPRARAVVEASVQLAEWQLRHERGDVPDLMSRLNQTLAQPA